MKFWRALVGLVSAYAFVFVQTAAIAQDAAANAKNTAATIAQGLQGTINSTVTSNSIATNVSGYDTNQTLSQGSYFNNPSQLSSAGASAAQSSAAYKIATTDTTVKIDPSTINVSTAKQVESNPNAYTGVSTSSSQGNCQAVPASSGTSTTYYDSCQIGSTEVDSSFSCNVVWNDVVATDNTYSCQIKTVWGLNNKIVAGDATSTKTNVATVSGCSQLAALSYCSKTGSSVSLNGKSFGVSGDGAIYTADVIQFPSYSVDVETDSYKCSQSVDPYSEQSPTLKYWASIDASGNPLIGSMSVTASSSSSGTAARLVSSTLDESACNAQIGTISCPDGTTLVNGQCSKSVPAVASYTCPAGWTLSGTTCTLQQASSASVSSYSCPANYTLSGKTCTSVQVAGPTGYTCPTGYTLSGSTCFQTLTQPARAASYTCPSGYTLSGTICYEYLTQAANASYSCPSGYALSGTTCTLTSQAAAVVSYTCPSGYTLNGSVCQKASSYQATVSYTCPSTWTLSGSTCTQSSTYNASLTYSCPSGFTLSGSNCLKNTSYQPTVNYSCPSGWSLNGSTCSLTTNYSATPNYSCSNGYNLNGSTCSTSGISAATVNYYCPSGWTQNGMTCNQVYSYSTSGTTCPSGGTIGNFTFSCHDIQWWFHNNTTGLDFQWGDSTDCGTFASQSSCHVKSSSGSHLVSGPTNIGGLTSSFYENDFVYECSTSTNYGTGSNANYCINNTAICYPSPLSNNPPAPVNGTSYTGATCTVNNSQPVSSSYSCPNGAVLNGQQCTTTQTQAANVYYSCADGSQPVGTICYQTSNQAATASYSCPSGGSFDGSLCQISTTQAATPNYSCPSGGSLNGTSCVITNSQAATSNYSCPSGGTLNGTTCNVTDLLPATAIYGCPQGSTLSGTMCLTTDTQTATANYSCPSNYALQGTTCVLSQSTNATPVLACPDGYTLDGAVCTETLSIQATQHYACATGYTLSGTTCTSTIEASVDGYACPSGYTVSGTTCVVSATQAAKLTYSCPNGGTLSGNNCISTSVPNSSSGLTCQAPVETCTDFNNTTRMIADGVTVTHACWQWSRSYQCAALKPANDCAGLQSKSNCKFDHESCLDDGCYTKSEVYLCTTPASSSTSQAQACSGDIYCIDGNCTQVSREASPDFASALTAINAMSDSSTQFDVNSLTIFSGTATGCHKPLFGLVNCCAGKVSGALSFAAGAAALYTGGAALIGLVTPFLALFMCSNEEMQLDVKDRMGLCHYVGEYCSQKLLFVCASLRHSYCCFQTKLARVMQEQGRQQLGKGWGTPQSPDCSGFTVDQFEQLDFSKMDFTEVFGDYTSAVSVPASLQSATQMQSKIQAYYAQHSGH